MFICSAPSFKWKYFSGYFLWYVYICLSPKGPSSISDLRDCFKKIELSDEDLIYLDELKRCFEGENLSKANESQIKKLGKLYSVIDFLLNWAMLQQ